MRLHDCPKIKLKDISKLPKNIYSHVKLIIVKIPIFTGAMDINTSSLI